MNKHGLVDFTKKYKNATNVVWILREFFGRTDNHMDDFRKIINRTNLVIHGATLFAPWVGTYLYNISIEQLMNGLEIYESKKNI